MPRIPILLTALALVGCSEYSANKAGTYASTGAPSDPGGTGTGTGGTTTAPPETEDDAFFELAPAQTDRYVFVANPGRNTLTRVDAETLAVRTVDVGADPRIVATTPDWTRVAVFNRADDSVSLLDVETLDEQRIDVRDNFNAMRVSPDGGWAVLWHDVAAESPDDPPAEGLQSFNEASFVDLESGDHWPLAVGFNPRDVVFTPDGALAAVVSDAYLALVPLDSTPLDATLIRLTDDVDPPKAEEVVLAPNRDFAFVRQFGATDILVVDLVLETVSPIAVGTNPTDFDLTPDGSELIVVARGSEELVTLRSDDPFGGVDITPMPAGEGFGQLDLDPTGQRAVLFTTSIPTARYAVWDRATDTVDLAALVKPVDKLTISPTGDTLLVVHSIEDDPDTDPSDPFWGSWAATVVDLDDGRTNPLLLPAPILDFAHSSDGTFGTFVMEAERWFARIDYLTLLHDEIALKSDPVYVGVLPDPDPTDGLPSQAWISQDHDLGRISFYDPSVGSLETITGFELNSEIE